MVAAHAVTHVLYLLLKDLLGAMALWLESNELS